MRPLLPLCLVLCLGCDSVTETVGRLVLSTEDEKQLGAQMAAEIEAKEKVHEDATVQAWLDSVAARVLAEVPAEDVNFEYQFTVIDDPQTVNAFALPGGHIYVYSALIALAQSEAEVAAVLGHEIAHVTQGHISQSLARQYGTSLLLSIALGEDPGALAEIVAGVAANGYLSKYSRDAESEADSVGLDYHAAAGYDPAAMATFFERLDQIGGGSDPLSAFFASHPDPGARADEVEQRIAREMLGGGAAELVGDFADVKMRVAGQ